MPGAAKRVAFLSVIFGSVVAVSLVVVSWDRVLEAWYIHRLSSDDVAVQLHAAERLVQLESVRSIPALIELVGRSDTGTGFIEYPLPSRGKLRRPPEPESRDSGSSEDAPPPTDPPPTRILLTPLAHCLFLLGSSSCDGSTYRVRKSRVDELLFAHGNEDNPALRCVGKAWRFPEVPVERRSSEGIEEARARAERDRLERLAVW